MGAVKERYMDIISYGALILEAEGLIVYADEEPREPLNATNYESILKVTGFDPDHSEYKFLKEALKCIFEYGTYSSSDPRVNQFLQDYKKYKEERSYV